MTVKLWSLQILRFFAALGVVSAHALWFARNATGQESVLFDLGNAIGQAGVDVFFVLSGVIIATIAPGMRPRDFAFKRLRRIYPIYLVLVVPWLAIAAWSGALHWRGLLSTLTLWPVTDRITDPASPVAWTLCFEMLFYACATAVLWRRWMLIVLLAAYMVALFAPISALLQFGGSPLCLEFLAGVALAQLPRRRWMRLALPLGLALLVACAFLPIRPQDAQLVVTDVRDQWLRVAAWGAPAALIVWGTLQFDAKPGLLSYLGDASYSLYLCHPLILMLWIVGLAKLLPAVPPDLLSTSGIVLCVLASWRIHEAIEKPLLNAFRPGPPKEVLASA